MTGERSQPIDIMRAMAIALVVLGHALIFCGKVSWLVRAIYAFHMPLMFSISGYVTAMSWRKVEKSGENLSAAAGRKIARSAKRLLVPYVFFALLLIPLVNAGIAGDMGEAFVDAWRKALLLNRSLWFLPCCFLLVCVYMASMGLRRLKGLRSLRGAVWEVVPCILALVPVGILYLLFPCIDYFRSTLSYAFSFFAGSFIFRFLSARSLTLDAALAHMGFPLRILAFFAFILATVLFGFFPRLAFKPLVGILSLIPVAILACKLACLPSPFSAVLSFVGQSTLVIYCFDFSITPMTIWWLADLNRVGVLSVPLLVLLTFLYVPVVVAFFCFLRFVWLENIAGKK